MGELAKCVMFTKIQLKSLSNRENELRDEYGKIFARIEKLTLE